MKILPLVKGIQNDITSTSIRLKKASLDGYFIADRTSKVYRQCFAQKYINVMRSVTSKVVEGTSKQELPYLAGAVGMLLPVPFLCPIFFCLGLLTRIPSRGAHIIYDSMSKANHIDIIR